MNKIHPGYNISSLFTAFHIQFAEKRRTLRHGFFYAILGAFFIVILSAVILQVILGSFPVSLAQESAHELAAFQPGQEASGSIFRGYIGIQ